MKRLYFITVVVLILLMSFVFAASKFPDVNGTKYEVAVTKLNSSGVIDGFEDGTFKPNNNVTRAQLCKLLVEALKLKRANNVELRQFSDVNSSMWFYDYVKIAVDNGIIIGYEDGTFRPNNDVKYSEMLTMIIRAMGKENQIANKSDWPNAYVTYASNYGLLSNVTYSDVGLPAIRGEVSIALYNMMNRLEEENNSKEVVTRGYGFVVSTSTKNKEDYVKIDGTTYLVSTKSDDFEVDTYVVFEKSNQKDDITLVASYGVKDLDANADIITAVKGTKAADQTIKVKGSSSYIDYFTKANISKYESYNICLIYVEPNSKNNLIVKKHSSADALDEVKFSTGDRIVEDAKTKVFLVFKGLDSDDTVKKGKYTAAEDDATYYTVSYKWASGYEVYGVDLPNSQDVKEGTKYTVKYPSSSEYNFYTRDGKDSFYVYQDTVVYITSEIKDQGGHAGSNMPLIDRMSEAEIKQEIKACLFEVMMERYGDDVTDVRVNIDNIMPGDSKDQVKFEVTCELHPASNAVINKLTIPDGEVDSESGWVVGKGYVGILNAENNDKDFYITNLGTGW